MLSQQQINEIREHLEKAQNPIFFFDNDADGLMSFILLRRYIGRGRGVAIKSFPGLDVSYFRRVEEFNADYVFILDKPVVSEDFFKEIEKKNLPVVWIDHHDVEVDIKNKPINYYNPVYSKQKSSEPVSYLCYKISNKKEDMWLAMVGCIADNFMPDFSEEFERQYPELWRKNAESAFEILYHSEFGKLVLMLDFSLKDRVSSVVSMINFLIKAKSPFDILNGEERHLHIIKRYNQVNSVYSNLLEKAKRIARNSRQVVFFQYSGQLSLSANLANELSYSFPGKVILVAYIKDVNANVSIRGNIDVRKLTLEAVKYIGNATGGGHEHATGAKMSADDLDKFRKFFEKELEQYS